MKEEDLDRSATSSTFGEDKYGGRRPRVPSAVKDLQLPAETLSKRKFIVRTNSMNVRKKNSREDNMIEKYNGTRLVDKINVCFAKERKKERIESRGRLVNQSRISLPYFSSTTSNDHSRFIHGSNETSKLGRFLYRSLIGSGLDEVRGE